jgi:hypothetical protein
VQSNTIAKLNAEIIGNTITDQNYRIHYVKGEAVMKSVTIILLAIMGGMTGTVWGAYSGGSGTAADPYQLSRVEDWQEFIATSDDWGSEKYFVLTADIDFGGATITPVGTDATKFTGVLDGDGRVLSNFVIDQPGSSYAGLFGFIDQGGQISDVGVSSFIVTGSSYVGGLCGCNYGTIRRSYTTGSVTGSSYYVGGLSGCNYGTISRSYATGSTAGISYYYVGGLSGGNYGTISRSYATGSVMGNNTVGGLCGRNNGTISRSYATGSVTGSSYVGGLCGINNATISQSNATGSVTGNYNAGGLCGYNNAAISQSFAKGPAAGYSCVGGLCGVNSLGSIMASYATGEVRGTEFVGGLCGINSLGSIMVSYATGAVRGTILVGGLCGLSETGGNYEDTGNFWDTETSGLNTSPMGMGKTAAEMQTQSTFTDAGWDFTESDGDAAEWWLPENGYPRLGWDIGKVGTFTLQKCTVKAGKTASADSVQISGMLDATAADLEAGSEIAVRLESEDMAVKRYVFPIDASTFMQGKFSVKDAATSLKIDPKNGKTAFSVQNADLTGLACPISVTITIGGFFAQVEAEEAIVNGSKPCPPQFLTGVRNSMELNKVQVKLGKTAGTDLLRVSGVFTVAETYDKANPVAVILGSQTFTVPGSQFVNKGFSEGCNNIVCQEEGLMKAKFDFSKCTFQIQVAKMTITESGVVDFRMDCFGNALPDQDIYVPSR